MSVVTVTVTVVATETVIRTVMYGVKRIAVVPTTGITDLDNLSARLFADDLVVCTPENVADFSHFTKQVNKAVLFNQGHNVATVVAAAQEWGAGLCCDVEGVTPPEVQAFLESIYAAVRAIDANIEFTFGAVYNNFLLYYADYADFCSRQVIQIQRAWKGTEETLTDDGVTKTQSVGDELYVQICAYTPNLNDEEITAGYVASVYEALRVKEVTAIWLYFATAAQEGLMLGILDLIGRPTP